MTATQTVRPIDGLQATGTHTRQITVGPYVTDARIWMGTSFNFFYILIRDFYTALSSVKSLP